ncbi:MAG: hypothetical protein ACSHX9_17690 [Luteolibacter sp.]
MKYFNRLLIPFALAGSVSAEPIHLDQPARIGEISQDHTEEGISSNLEAGWTSCYIAEGREAFGEDGMTTFLAILGYQDFSLELWQAFSDGSSSREFQASVFYTFPTEMVSATLGLTHINDTRGGDEDLDISLTLSGELFSALKWETIYYYGFDRGGSYLETGISRTWETECVDITLGAHLGTNFGYVEDGHEGADHFVLSADFSKAITESLTLSAGYSYVFDIDRDTTRNAEDLELYQGSVFGFAAEYSF